MGYRGKERLLARLKFYVLIFSLEIGSSLIEMIELC